MSVIWDSSILKEIANAKSNRKWKATGLEIDSRKVKKGDLFCAIKGSKLDGHNFIKGAMKNGAAACLVSNNNPALNEIAFAKVNSVIKTIEKMAIEARRRSKAKFIAITGSVGKTGTKEMFRTCFSKITDIFASQSSFNNHIGVPVSLSQIPESALFCVLEVGMNKKGEIKKLSELIKPDLAIITAVEQSHLQGLKDLRNIALAKSEILYSLPKYGCFIFNKDTNFSQILNDKAIKLKINNIISYGKSDYANIKLINFKLNNNVYYIKANCFEKIIEWEMPAIGEHWIHNSLSIIAAGIYYDLDMNSILAGLRSFKLPLGRGNIIKLSITGNSFWVIDDSYNSNPASLSAALRSLTKVNNKGKKIVVLGDMLELGKKSLVLHQSFKNQIETGQIKALFTIGQYMKELYKIIDNDLKKYHFDNLDSLTLKLKSIIEKDDMVLIKGSNSMNLNKIIKNIINEEVII